MIILDTDILIDYSRNLPQAREFLDITFKTQRYYISVITAIELIRGTKNKRSQIAVQYLVSKFKILPTTKKVSLQAYNLVNKYHLGYSLAMQMP